MRNFIIPTAIAAVLLTSPMAMAAATATATGKIKAFDLKAMTVTLANGAVYTLPAGFKNPGLKNGEMIKVSWAMENGKHVANRITIVK